MILLDTCALIFDALSPEKLSDKAVALIDSGRLAGELAISDISLWEVAMLVSRKRITSVKDVQRMLNDMLLANRLTVLPITASIAVTASDDRLFTLKDPADRIIAATAIHHNLPLITCDNNLRTVEGLTVIW